MKIIEASSLSRVMHLLKLTLLAFFIGWFSFGAVATTAFADKLPQSELTALDEYPNWVGACGSGAAATPADAGAGAATNGVTYTAEMTIDDDGIGPSHGDPYHQSHTAYADGKLNADETNYIALAGGYASAHGLELGDIALVEHNGKSAYAVFGDKWQNVNQVHGEGSVHLSIALGGDATNTLPAPVKFTVYPGTHTQLAGSVDQSKIDQIGAQVSGRGAGSGGAGGITGPVYILGDSISNAAKSQLKTAFQDKGADIYINASDSRSITGAGVTAGFKTSGLQAVADDKDRIAASPTIVIELGTNPNPNFEKSIKDLIDKIHSYNADAKIFWVNLFSVGKAPNKVDQAGTNETISNQSAQLHYTVIDTVGQTIELEPDQVHETVPTGAKQLAKIIVDAVGSASVGDAIASAACCASGSVASGGSLSGGTNAAKAFNYFISPPRSLSPEAAAGIVGNMMIEAPGTPTAEDLDTHAHNDISGTHDGIVQWSTSRWAALKRYESGKDPYDLAVQLDYVWYELTHTYKATLGALKTVDNPEDAASIFNNGPPFPAFEASGPSGNDSGRRTAAGVIFHKYGKTSPSAPAPGDPAAATPTTGGCDAGSPTGGNADLKKTVTVSTKGKFITLPGKYGCGGVGYQIDSRIAADVAYLVTTYNMCITAGLADGHKSHGVGIAVDLVPKNGNGKSDWTSSTEAAARAIGWWGDGADDAKGSKDSCANYVADGSCMHAVYPDKFPEWLRWMGYNGASCHGDPWHVFGGCSAHLHIGWDTPSHTDAVSPVIISDPVPAVLTFPAPIPDDIKSLVN